MVEIPLHDPRHPSQDRTMVCEPEPHWLLQPPDVVHADQSLCPPREQEAERVEEPVHEPQSPEQTRAWPWSPTPHAVEQPPTVYQLPHDRASPLPVHGMDCSRKPRQKS